MCTKEGTLVLQTAAKEAGVMVEANTTLAAAEEVKKVLKEEVAKLKEENMKLMVENMALKGENMALKGEIPATSEEDNEEEEDMASDSASNTASDTTAILNMSADEVIDELSSLLDMP